MNYFFSEDELDFNASLNAWDLLLQMGFNENSLYREGNTIRLFCPLHKDQIRRSMIIYTDRNAYKCQYTNCEGYRGGNLLEFYSQYMGVEMPDVISHVKNQGTDGVDLVDRADKLIQEGSLVDALPLLQKAVQLDPTNEISRCRLAALYLELGDKEAGYKEYMTAAEHFGVRGELDKTLNIYNILIIITPDDVKVRKQLSYLFSRLGRQDEAVAQLKWVVDRHIRKGELPEAVQISKKMLELQPQYPAGHRILGEILLKQGDYFEAVEELRTATALFLQEKNLKKAKDTVELGLRYTPGNQAMKEMKGKIEQALSMQAEGSEASDEREREFENWLHELKVSIGLAEPVEKPKGRPATHPGLKPKPLTTPAAEKSPVAAVQVEQESVYSVRSRADRRPTTDAGKRGGAKKQDANVPITRDGKDTGESTIRLPRIEAVNTPTSERVHRGASTLISPDDPRIALCTENLKDRSPDELASLHQHIINMFNDVQRGFKEGLMSEFEVNVIREFYAAFCIALDAKKPPTPGTQATALHA